MPTTSSDRTDPRVVSLRLPLVSVAVLLLASSSFAAASSPDGPESADDTRSIAIGVRTPAPPDDSEPAPPPLIASIPEFEEPGTRHAVVIGINEYRDSSLNLRFCVPDARLIHGILTDPRRGGVPPENAVLLLDGEATRHNIELAFDDLVSRVEPDDMVFIYYAGHGTPSDNNLYFWVTHDADLRRLRVTSLSNDRIAEFLHDVPSNRMVKFLDSCYSLGTVAGRSGPVPLPSGDPFSSLVSQGRVTFTATSGKEKAIELADLGHGAFTYYLGEALGGQADTNLDGWVDLDEAWAYLNTRVTAQAAHQGHPQNPYRFGASTFGLRLTRDPDFETRIGPLESGLALLVGNGEITRLEHAECIRILNAPLDQSDPRERQWVVQLAQGDLAPAPWRRLISRNRTGQASPPDESPEGPAPTPPPLPTAIPATPTPTPTPEPTPVVRAASPWSRMTDRERLRLLVSAIRKYYEDTGTVPPHTSPRWYAPLVEDDGTPGWRGPYIGISAEHPPIDRFMTPLVYEVVTMRLPGRQPVMKVKVISCGVDGIYDRGLKNDLVEEATLRR